MARYAQGKYALAISDISGQAFPWNEMVTQWNGLFVHYSEFESKQPQLDPKPSQADPTALPKTRPQQPPPDTLRFLDFNPLRTFAAGSPIVNVSSINHGRSYGDYVRFRGAPTTSSSASTDPQFSNIANIDGITGATICQAAGYIIYPGLYTSFTTTLNGAIDATTTDVILTSVTGFNGVTTSPFEPTIANPSGTPTYGALVGTEIISYTGVGPANNIQQTFSVKVVNTASGNKYYIDNVQQDTLNFNQKSLHLSQRSLASNGYLETVTWSFTDSKIDKQFTKREKEISILNPISSDLDVLRRSIFSNLALHLKKNQDRESGAGTVWKVLI